MPTPEVLLAGVIVAALAVYVVLGGADFGGGVWDLLAFGPRRDAQREAIALAMSPVWEVNHVWLILALVLLFAAFPPAFAAVFTVLHVPLTVFLVGVVLRGAAFAFRAYEARSEGERQRWGVVFSSASLLAPVLLGMCAAALFRPVSLGAGLEAWATFGGLSAGFFVLSSFAFLAATYLCAEGVGTELADDFRRRALGSVLAKGVSGVATLLFFRATAPNFFSAMTSRIGAGGVFVAALAAGGVAIWALWRRRCVLARLLAATEAGLVVAGCGLARAPYWVEPRWTVHNAASPPSTLRLLIWALAAGALVLLPSLFLLFRVFKMPVRKPGRA
ncbi:MAG: cytochrome d ubiquinol oxidase subunit II [Myxococcaceae bacterium]